MRLVIAIFTLTLVASCGPAADYPANNDVINDRYGGEPSYCDLNDCSYEPSRRGESSIDSDDRPDEGPGDAGGVVCNEYVGCVDIGGAEDHRMEEDRVDHLNEGLERQGR